MPVTPARCQQFHQRLHRWYREYGRRDLPWRNTQDPYAIYVSEIMLQQTQVKTVLERYYQPFLKRFPTLRALAKSDADDVLQAWQGLGYYSRALNLRAVAVACKTKLPDTVDGLMALPGIGRNTAHAICAFAYHQPLAVMEANVKRVVCRVFALTHPKEQELWGKATLLLDTQNPFDYNQAMMDIGSMVCTKRKPLCDQCPLEAMCEGKDTPESYPAPKQKKAVPVRHKHIAVLQSSDGLYYAVPRTSRFLNGLYHFIETGHDQHGIMFDSHHYAFSQATALGHIRQQYSHFTLEADVWLIHVGKAGGNSWYDFPSLSALPVSMAEGKVISLILRLIESPKTAKSKSGKRHSV